MRGARTASAAENVIDTLGEHLQWRSELLKALLGGDREILADVEEVTLLERLYNVRSKDFSLRNPSSKRTHTPVTNSR